jgi:predicted metal-dependent peptidase
MIDNVHSEIAKYSKTLMFKEPFYGLFLIGLNKKLNKNIQTACVCKENINTSLMINPEFWVEQDENTKVGILKHELLHIAFHHLENLDSYGEKELLNIAADIEINQFIEKEWKGKTWNGLEIDKKPFKELNLPKKAGTRVYYDLLYKEAKDNPNGNIAKMLGALKGNIGMPGMGGEPGKGVEGTGGDGPGNEVTITLDDGSTMTVPCTHEMWKEFEGMSEADKKLLGKQIDHQLKEVANIINKSRGTIPSEMVEYINGLFEIVEAVIDWKSYLRRFNGMATKVYTKKTRRKLNKRFAGNPALKIKQRKNTLVAIDTSGSVSNKDLEEFFNEIHHIYKTGTEVDIIECDAAIQRVYKYDGKQKDKIEVKGRGGTSFEPVMVYLKEHKGKYQNIIYLTDGGCSAPDTPPARPILWVICESGQIGDDLPGAKVQIKR